MNARNYSTRSRFSGLSCLAAILLVTGCSDEPFPLVRVEGKITYEDGELIPPDNLMIRFVPLTPPRDERTHPRPGTTFPDENGNFSTTIPAPYHPDGGFVTAQVTDHDGNISGLVSFHVPGDE